MSVAPKTGEPIVIFDFDSTVVTIETLDELAAICLQGMPDADLRHAKIAEITRQGMLGEIGFAKSLALRVNMFAPTKEDVASAKRLALKRISPSFESHKEVIRRESARIWIVSGGFRELILPVATYFGIAPEHILANEFKWSDNKTKVVGYDEDNALAQDGGKVRAINEAGLPDGSRFMVGDGMTDAAVKQSRAADEFIAYTETVRREPVVKEADFVAASFQDVMQYVCWAG